MTLVEPGPSGRALFALLVEYVAPREEVDALLDDHARYLDRFSAEGTFLLSGRQVPRTGGFILAAAEDRGEMEAIVAQDPFVRGGAAEYRIVHVSPSKAEPLIQVLLTAHRAWP